MALLSYFADRVECSGQGISCSAPEILIQEMGRCITKVIPRIEIIRVISKFNLPR